MKEGSLPWLFPLALLGTVGRDSRLLLVAWVAAAAFFTAWSGGDWMKGARWLSFLVPSLAVLGGLGLARLVPPRGAVRVGALLVALGLVGAWTASQVLATSAYAEAPETSPMSVRARLVHAREIQADLLLEDPTWLDIDTGASTTWSRMAVVDYGRLLDVPLAHHKYRSDVLEEHLSTASRHGRSGRLPASYVRAAAAPWESVRVDGWIVGAGRAWYSARKWRVGETVRTRAVFRVGQAVPFGQYRLRVRARGAEGGDWHEITPLHVVTVEQGSDRLKGARRALVDQAALGDCDGALAGWEALRLMTPRERRPTAESRRVLAAALGSCLRTRVTVDPEQASSDLATLVNWQPDDPQTQALVQEHADAWMARADSARRAGSAIEATALYDQILRVDPSRTWARRRKEELRAAGPVGTPRDGPS